MSESQQSSNGYSWVAGMGLGIGAGAVLGLAMNTIGAGIALGAGIGTMFAIVFNSFENDSNEELAE